LLKHVIEGKIGGRINMTGRRGRRRRQLLDDVKGTSTYWILKDEALDLILRGSGFGRGHEPVVRLINHYYGNSV
jgi:hypothetical protein